jgi:tRNA (cytidine/uridine-2'-O-)-methyltransferase
MDELKQALPESRFVYFSKKAELSYVDWLFQPEDCLVFGRETRGLPEELLQANWDSCLKIPMLNSQVRSLNLATAVAMVLGEALRQTDGFRQ